LSKKACGFSVPVKVVTTFVPGPNGARSAVVEIRKPVAVLVSDVVGYSRLAGADEDRIRARLRALRSDLIDPIIAVHNGRVVKRTEDGAIVEFRSVVDAVRFAIRCRTVWSNGTPAFRQSERHDECARSSMRVRVSA
jgi:class 3 adenylate cyclase